MEGGPSVESKDDIAQNGDHTDDALHFNPLQCHFDSDIGLLLEDDPASTLAATKLFKEGSLKDVPCKFHDGYSGQCWKKDCPYGHELYTGGEFAKREPMLAFAAGNRKEVTPVTRLPAKPFLTQESRLNCRITHVVNPSEFFIRPVDDDPECICTGVKKLAAKLRAEEEHRKRAKREADNPMDAYYYGYAALEPQPNLSSKPEVKAAAGGVDREKLANNLQTSLQQGLYYRRIQSDYYFAKVELVAVRKEGGTWERGIVKYCPEPQGPAAAGLTNEGNNGGMKVRVQLLDTGESITMSAKDVCRLPAKFTEASAAAFRCCLHGVIPTWSIWTKRAIESFRQMVEGQEVKIIIKEGLHKGTTQPCATFEQRPYMVKISVLKDGEFVDVAAHLIEEGFGIQVNPFPFRPMVKKILDPGAYDFLSSPVPNPLPANALSVEKERLAWAKRLGQ